MTLEDALKNDTFTINLDNQDFETCYAMLNESERYQLALFLAEEGLDPLKDLDYIPDVLFSHLSFETFNIPNRIKKIGKHAFSHNSELTYIELPDSVELINSYAFYNCTSLTDINIPPKVKRIPIFCFSDCESLQQIKLPEGIKRLEPWCFASCINLRAIYLPASLEEIEPAAFNGCKNLKDIYFSGTANQWKAVLKGKGSFRDVPTRLAKCSDAKTVLR